MEVTEILPDVTDTIKRKTNSAGQRVLYLFVGLTLSVMFPDDRSVIIERTKTRHAHFTPTATQRLTSIDISNIPRRTE
ncbi:hypothetical protein V1478_007179 [Vespula squamosa]|uniref:Uncharacterized protein n=1 Tax=Vespula squamosa TaxID=30214 RepID=A0ABD2B2J2_VESSQ